MRKKLLPLLAALLLIVAPLWFPVTVRPQCAVPAQGAVLKTGGYTATGADAGRTFVMNCSSCTLTLPSTPQSPVWKVWVTTTSSGTVSINPNGVSMRAPDRATASTATLNLSNFVGTTIMIDTDGTYYYASGTTNSVPYGVAAGTAQAQTLAVNQWIGAYTPGAVYMFMPTTSNTASDPTLNVNGLGAVAVKKDQGGALVALSPGDIADNIVAWVVYDGTYFQLLNPAKGRGAAPVTLTDATTIVWTITNSTISNAAVTIAASRNLSIVGAVAGWSGTLVVKQDSGGGHLLALPAGSKVANGGAGSITLTQAGNAVDILTVYYDGTTYWWTYGKNFN